MDPRLLALCLHLTPPGNQQVLVDGMPRHASDSGAAAAFAHDRTAAARDIAAVESINVSTKSTVP